MFLVDSHCHFDLLEESDNQYISRAKEQGVYFFLNVCVKLSRFDSMLQLASKQNCVALSVGLHPNEQEEETNQDDLVSLAEQNPAVIAIGETGLDYFRSTGELAWQKERFRQHIAAAKKVNLPLIIHTRQAKEDTIRILQEENANIVGGVMHCFTEDWEMAKQALDLGFYISFSGIVTFKNAQIIQETAKNVPLDRMLIETDAPYLAPNPHRGKVNEPAYVRHTAEFLANLKQVPLLDFAHQTTNNFFNLFKMAKRPHV